MTELGRIEFDISELLRDIDRLNDKKNVLEYDLIRAEEREKEWEIREVQEKIDKVERELKPLREKHKKLYAKFEQLGGFDR